eukprot:CAMPEP_0182525320 /NCGR_PEP_ID=MMETSP1323-20130603/2398_1 /TAXON_ID=236787 /ORGANISM="Florenciella parvula, Strain RCC1693" /LENGTH=161 /DNA_ID=CAMNT_0024734021 /DNA_START=220 /DNA_END=704 /DNA_ORIENTATION=+
MTGGGETIYSGPGGEGKEEGEEGEEGGGAATYPNTLITSIAGSSPQPLQSPVAHPNHDPDIPPCRSFRPTALNEPQPLRTGPLAGSSCGAGPPLAVLELESDEVLVVADAVMRDLHPAMQRPDAFGREDRGKADDQRPSEMDDLDEAAFAAAFAAAEAAAA